MTNEKQITLRVADVGCQINQCECTHTHRHHLMGELPTLSHDSFGKRIHDAPTTAHKKVASTSIAPRQRSHRNTKSCWDKLCDVSQRPPFVLHTTPKDRGRAATRTGVYHPRLYMTGTYSKTRTDVRPQHSPFVDGQTDFFLVKNLPFSVENKWRLLGMMVVFFGSGFVFPFIVVRHQILKK
ncbi:hypothetical protein F2P81_013820 [Scophthalmus maximus]|uniref:Cytochrome c oxidase subunit 7C, mitochondrial n=1 Tax=Scophthalmus maximus TaxID=52904 RepID=A0A6A4SRT5_SCOMX|nr:hypothetical protein F2P81_013820 [Scophthalmus maximus]